MMQLMKNQKNHSSEARRVLNFNILRMYWVFKFFKYSNYYFITQNNVFMNLLDTFNLYSGWLRFRSSISNSSQITSFIPSRNQHIEVNAMLQCFIRTPCIAILNNRIYFESILLCLQYCHSLGGCSFYLGRPSVLLQPHIFQKYYTLFIRLSQFRWFSVCVCVCVCVCRQTSVLVLNIYSYISI